MERCTFSNSISPFFLGILHNKSLPDGRLAHFEGYLALAETNKNPGLLPGFCLGRLVFIKMLAPANSIILSHRDNISYTEGVFHMPPGIFHIWADGPNISSRTHDFYLPEARIEKSCVRFAIFPSCLVRGDIGRGSLFPCGWSKVSGLLRWGG